MWTNRDTIALVAILMMALCAFLGFQYLHTITARDCTAMCGKVQKFTEGDARGSPAVCECVP